MWLVIYDLEMLQEKGVISNEFMYFAHCSLQEQIVPPINYLFFMLLSARHCETFPGTWSVLNHIAAKSLPFTISIHHRVSHTITFLLIPPASSVNKIWTKVKQKQTKKRNYKHTLYFPSTSFVNPYLRDRFCRIRCLCFMFNSWYFSQHFTKKF